jgi:HTH-type transcriptional regulator, competence development regulator
VKETFGEFIHNQRLTLGLTLTKLAAALDIDQSTLSKIENHKRSVPEDLLPKLAKIFKVELRELQKEYYSERIAQIIYATPDPAETLMLAEEKVKYLKAKHTKQGRLSL